MSFELTQKLPLISELLKLQREQKKAVRRTKMKLEKEARKYSFLNEMLFEKGDDLIPVLIRCLKSAGYKKVYDVDPKRLKQNKNKVEDIHIHYNDALLICEVTSRKDNSNPPNSKCSVPSIYVANVKPKFPDKKVHGILIINSWYEQSDMSKRNKLPFNSDQLETAVNMGCGLTTTKQLVNGYIKLKRGEITFNQFHKKLLKSGEIIF